MITFLSVILTSLSCGTITEKTFCSTTPCVIYSVSFVVGAANAGVEIFTIAAPNAVRHH